MGSCQSWLHRHKAGGGPTLRRECPKYSPIAFHRVHPGGSNNWQLPAHLLPPLSLSTGFSPVGATTDSYTLCSTARIAFHRV